MIRCFVVAMCGGDPWNVIYFNIIYMYYVSNNENNENNTPAEFHMHKHTMWYG